MDIKALLGGNVEKAVKLAMKAHENLHFLLETSPSDEALFAFPGSWSSPDHWYTRNPFGELKIPSHSRFPFPPINSSCGDQETAVVNEAFVSRFHHILSNSSLQIEVEKALSKRKQIIFTGHSLGGAIAVLSTIWFFEKYITTKNHNRLSPFCLTFGSPLVGSSVFSQALRRESLDRYFIHFVTRYDIVPRIMLSPLSSIEQGLAHVLEFMNPKSPRFLNESVGKSSVASTFLIMVMRNALLAASHTACCLKGCTNLLLETVSSIVALSPYSPFGIFAFCTGDGKLVVLDNPDAVLLLLFFCLQLNLQTDDDSDFVYKMFQHHFSYEAELQRSMNLSNVTYLDNLADIPLHWDARTNDAAALNDLGLSTRARLCLRAAGELEKQKLENQKRIDSNKEPIKEALKKIEEYQTTCRIRKKCYYDAFKTQRDPTHDFDANIKRLELAGIWDEIIEMIRRRELPDGFEGRKEWIELGTLYRRLVEPLDIANYYRHLKNEDTGPYMVKARPQRYRFTQKWREHAERMAVGSSWETTFWAEVEELRMKSYDEVKDKVLRLEENAVKWLGNGLLCKDVFLDESTFIKWWKTLPLEHTSTSCIAGYILFPED